MSAARTGRTGSRSGWTSTGSYASELIEHGHAYHCFCSAEQLEADRRAALEAGRPPQYAGRCRDLDPGGRGRAPRAGRARRRAVPRAARTATVAFQDLVRGTVQFSTEVIGDPVLVRSDGNPAYNFAVVIDDALMEITHVIRGEDHISNTPRQVLLYEALGFEPPMFAHLALVLGPDHTPLSKRHGATSVAEFRRRGYLPESLVNYLALLGWSPGGGDELLPAPELARRFALEDVGHSAAVFDVEKLAWVNRHYLRGGRTRRGWPNSRCRTSSRPGIVRSDTAGGARVPGERGAAGQRVGRSRSSRCPRGWRSCSTSTPVARASAPTCGRCCSEAGRARGHRGAGARSWPGEPRLDRETFRAAAGRVKAATG